MTKITNPPSTEELQVLQHVFKTNKDVIMFDVHDSIEEVLEQCIYGTGFYDCRIDQNILWIQKQGNNNKTWYPFEIPKS